MEKTVYHLDGCWIVKKEMERKRSSKEVSLPRYRKCQDRILMVLNTYYDV